MCLFFHARMWSSTQYYCIKVSSGLHTVDYRARTSQFRRLSLYKRTNKTQQHLTHDSELYPSDDEWCRTTPTSISWIRVGSFGSNFNQCSFFLPRLHFGQAIWPIFFEYHPYVVFPRTTQRNYTKQSIATLGHTKSHRKVPCLRIRWKIRCRFVVRNENDLVVCNSAQPRSTENQEVIFTD